MRTPQHLRLVLAFGFMWAVSGHAAATAGDGARALEEDTQRAATFGLQAGRSLLHGARNVVARPEVHRAAARHTHHSPSTPHAKPHTAHRRRPHPKPHRKSRAVPHAPHVRPKRGKLPMQMAVTRRKCGAANVTAAELRRIDAATRPYVQGHFASASARAEGSAAPILIRVYIHVIQVGADGDVLNGWITDAQAGQQVAVLNAAFAGAGFSFVLAGLQRVTNHPEWWNIDPTSPAANDMRAALHQGTLGDLNFYVTPMDDYLLGLTAYPWGIAPTPSQDGVMLHTYCMPGGPFSAYNLGNTGVHETGHWFGLLHTFEPAGNANGCEEVGDGVADTPWEAQPQYGCPDPPPDSCPNRPAGQTKADPIHNFMDYSVDACMNQFTPDQVARMALMFTTYRAASYVAPKGSAVPTPVRSPSPPPSPAPPPPPRPPRPPPPPPPRPPKPPSPPPPRPPKPPRPPPPRPPPPPSPPPAVVRSPGLAVAVYKHPHTLPLQDGFKADGSSTVATLNFTAVPATAGLSAPLFALAGRTQNFTMRFSGWLRVLQTASYVFQLGSDNGSLMYIDGQLLIDNSGLHGNRLKAASASLVQGFHSIQVQYMQASGGAALTLQMSAPGGTAATVAPVSPEALSH